MIGGKKISVLLVFKDESIISMLNTIFTTKYNANIDVAKEIFEFNKLTRATTYDLIFIDMSFSKTFFSTLKEFGEKEANSKVPILYIAPSINESEYEKSIELSAFDVISKPFNFSHIYSTIDYILEKGGQEHEVRNRRHTARTSDKVTIKFQPTEGAGQNIRYKAPAENISVSGVQLTRGAELANSSTLDLEILISGTYGVTSIAAKGNVQWKKRGSGDDVTVGIKFYDLSEDDREKLSKALYSG